MAIQYNENIKVAAPNPLDKRYLSNRTLNGGQLPYLDIAEVNSTIILSERYVGLTVNIMGVEYWFKDDTSTLIEKKYDTIIPSQDFVTGATNLGYFNGYSGIQRLEINKTGGNEYDGYYNSLYGYYYRGTDQVIHVGTPSDGIQKRGYLRNPVPVVSPTYKSWIWNEYVAGTNQLGWILIDGDISQLVGTVQAGVVYYPPAVPYTYTSWTSGTSPNNGSGLIFDSITGSLTTGTTITVGGGVFAQKVGKILQFKAIETSTPDIISISSNEANIFISGNTQIGANLGSGAGVYESNLGSTLQFRSIVGSGDTTVTQSGNNIIIYSSGGTGGGSTGGNQLYTGQTPSAVNLCGITVGYILTGKTLTCIVQDLLVPELYQTSVGTPTTTVALSVNGTCEVGCSIIQTVIPTYSRGAITPQYLSTSGFRGGVANAYSYSGPSLTAGFVGSVSCTINPYVVTCGAQTWCVCTKYDEGACVKGSKGTVNPAYPTACPLNSCTTYGSAAITGLYPYYYGKLASGSRPSVTQALITGGTKVVASSTGTVSVNFNSGDLDYTWLAIPAASLSRQSWYISVSNKGSVNTSVLDKYPDEQCISINSGQGCWTGIQYKVYMSKTVGTNIVPIEFRTTPNI